MGVYKNLNNFKKGSKVGITHILVSSISGKVSLVEIIRSSIEKQNLNLYVVGADSNRKALARHFVDQFWHMPLLDNLPVADLITYCKENDIQIIFPTREEELAYFAKHRDTLERENVFVMVSSVDALEKVQDKLLFYEYLIGKNYPAILTTTLIDKLENKTQHFVVKERFGAGSRGLHLNVTGETAIAAAKQLKEPIFQPFVDGTEYSIDVYVSKDGKAKGAVVRERVVVIDGESKVTRTVKNVQLEQLGKNLAEDLHLRGHVMFQVIIDHNEQVHIVECNPRFGGASTLSVAAGLHSFSWFILEAQGKSLDEYPFKRSERELTQVRYEKDLIF